MINRTVKVICDHCRYGTTIYPLGPEDAEPDFEKEFSDWFVVEHGERPRHFCSLECLKASGCIHVPPDAEPKP